MLVYRIAHKRHNDHLFAPGIAGRWNGAGKRVLYCSESIPLAFLECMIRRQGVGFNHDYNIIVIDIPDDLPMLKIAVTDLTGDWRNFRDYLICQKIGNAWFDESKTPVLQVPSAVITECHNYVLNTIHADYRRVRVVAVTDLVPDARIDELIRSYGMSK